eukprot:322947_1
MICLYILYSPAPPKIKKNWNHDYCTTIVKKYYQSDMNKKISVGNILTRAMGVQMPFKPQKMRSVFDLRYLNDPLLPILLVNAFLYEARSKLAKDESKLNQYVTVINELMLLVFEQMIPLKPHVIGGILMDLFNFEGLKIEDMIGAFNDKCKQANASHRIDGLFNYGIPNNYCLDYQFSVCFNKSCKKVHLCIGCSEKHPIWYCKTMELSSATQGMSKAGMNYQKNKKFDNSQRGGAFRGNYRGNNRRGRYNNYNHYPRYDNNNHDFNSYNNGYGYHGAPQSGQNRNNQNNNANATNAQNRR